MKKKKTIPIVIFLLFSFITNSLFLGLPKTAYGYVKDSSFSNRLSEYDFKVGETYEGFKLIEEKPLPGGNSAARIFYHQKSGARLFAMQNNDNNKYFSVAFRTPSQDSKGTAHIIEHCALVGGSKKYPVKQLFKKIMENSLTKNLNGCTYPDMTVYPFSTTNDKEFKNIMDMYLDMVFNPRFYEEKQVFKEEAWHYEMDSIKDNIKYNGVVYNEMKGAMSSPTELLYNYICESLYPDTNYAHVSGGDPKHITSLNFSELKEFYSRYYNPGNSYMFLYGNVDLRERLKFINENYLKNRQNTYVDSRVKIQKPFDERRERNLKYAIGKEEDDNDKTYICLNYALNNNIDSETRSTFGLLSNILFSSASPLIKDLEKKGFKGVTGGFSASQAQPFFTIIAANTNENQKENLIDAINTSLKAIVKKGLPKKLIQSTLNTYELNVKQMGAYISDVGMFYNQMVLSNWIYDKNPLEDFSSNKNLEEKIKSSVDRKYLESFIDKYVLKNSHNSVVVLKPEKGLREKEMEGERKRLEVYKNSLSEKELLQIVEENKTLKAWQKDKSRKEDNNIVPKINLKDIEPEINLSPLIKRKEKGVEVLYHPVYTNETVLLNLYFDTKGVKQEKIPYINLLGSLLGKMDTKKHSNDEIKQEELFYTGGINYGVENYISSGEKSKYNPKLIVSSRCLKENSPKMLKLISEEIDSTIFNNKKLLKSAIEELKKEQQENIYSSPHMAAYNRNLSYFSEGEKYNDLLRGLSYRDFLEYISHNFDRDYDEIISNLKDVSQVIFNKNNLTISAALEHRDYEDFKVNIDEFIGKLPKEGVKKQNYNFAKATENEGFTSTMNVQYNCQGFNSVDCGYNYSGKMCVLQNILNLDYLWDSLRVVGGSYGGNIIINRNGDMALVSYRDPKLKDTFKAYEGIADYINNLDLTDEQFESYKISTLSPYFTPKNLFQRINYVDGLYFKNITRDYLEKELEDILDCSLKDIKEYSKLFKKGISKGYITVIGNEKEIKDNKNLFKKIENLFK